jgi:hypothetical protein
MFLTEGFIQVRASNVFFQVRASNSHTLSLPTHAALRRQQRASGGDLLTVAVPERGLGAACPKGAVPAPAPRPVLLPPPEREGACWGGTADAPTGAGFSHNARGFSRAHTVQGGRGHPVAGRRGSWLFTPCYSAGGQLRPRAKTTVRLLRTTSSTDVPGARRRAAGTVKQARVAKQGCRASGWAATALPRQV